MDGGATTQPPTMPSGSRQGNKSFLPLPPDPRRQGGIATPMGAMPRLRPQCRSRGRGNACSCRTPLILGPRNGFKDGLVVTPSCEAQQVLGRNFFGTRLAVRLSKWVYAQASQKFDTLKSVLHILYQYITRKIISLAAVPPNRFDRRLNGWHLRFVVARQADTFTPAYTR